MKRASSTHGGRWLAQTNYDTLMTHHTTKNRLLPIYTSILLLKLGVDIQSQTEVRVRKPNKANLRDLIAATSIVILLKIGFKLSIIGPFHLEIWWMTLKINRAPLLYIKLCASFQSHQWIQTGVTVRKHYIRVKISDFLPMWPRNLMDNLAKK